MDKIIIDLVSDSGFKWLHSRNISVKGYLFDPDNCLYQNEKMVDYFSNITIMDDFKAKLRDADGNFAVVIRNSESIFAATDRVRSIPLFYSLHENTIQISDKAYKIVNDLSSTTSDKSSLLALSLTGYTIGENTVIREIKQIQAGECICLSSECKLHKEFYFEHLHTKKSITTDLIFEKLSSISNNMINRLLKTVENRQIVIPLSGGYDSRYILAMLKKNNVKNVVCYTYGRRESHEVKIAKIVADQLGYIWHFIEYNKDTWQNFLNGDIRNYLQESHNFSSVPHIQEFYAIDYLVKNMLIDSDAVFIPGFCGDLLGGSFLIENDKINNINLSTNGISDYIYKKHFNLYKYKGKNQDQILNSIKVFTEKFPVLNTDELVSINEHFFTCHKVAKFIINSLRVYEYYGFEWRIPLWDNELIEFWYSIPNQYREKNKLYNTFLMQNVFKPYNIDISKNESNSYLSKVKKMLPDFVKDPVVFILNSFIFKKSRDFNSFNELSRILSQDLNNQYGVDSIFINENPNYFITKWFIEKYITPFVCKESKKE